MAAIKAIGKKTFCHPHTVPISKKNKKSSPQIHHETLVTIFQELYRDENHYTARSVTPYDKLSRAIRRNDIDSMKKLVTLAIEQDVSLTDVAEAILDEYRTKYPEGCKNFEKIVKIALIKIGIKNQSLDHIESPFSEKTKMHYEANKTITEAIDELILENQEQKPKLELLKSEIDAILRVEKKRHQLEPIEILDICLKVNRIFENTFQEEPLYLRRSESNLSRAVIIDFTRRLFVILSKKFGALHAEGGFKKVSDAVQVYLKENTVFAKRMVRAVNKFEKKIYESELDFEREYGHNDAIISYPAKRDASVLKTNFIQEAFDSDLYIFTGNVSKTARQELTLEQIVDIIDGIAKTIAEMHKKGHVHRDLKAKNVLFRKNEDGSICVKVCDYGHANAPINKMVSDRYPKVHGTLRYTPPEVLEDYYSEPFNPLEQLKAVDMYGLGSILYELVTVEKIPWGHDVWAALKENKKIARKSKIRALELQKSIPKELLNENIPPQDSLKKYLLFVAARLLDPNPENRMKIEELQRVIQVLKIWMKKNEVKMA